MDILQQRGDLLLMANTDFFSNVGRFAQYLDTGESASNGAVYQFESVAEELGINLETCGLNELKNLIVEIQGRKNKLATCFPVSRFSQDAMQARHEELVKCEKILRRRFL